MVLVTNRRMKVLTSILKHSTLRLRNKFDLKLIRGEIEKKTNSLCPTMITSFSHLYSHCILYSF